MLITLGISHKTAPIDIREKLAFSPEHIPLALQSLIDEAALDEAALLSTCNRTEFYCSMPAVEQVQAVLCWWQRYQQTTFAVKPYLYIYSDLYAIKHIMRVASGLDSMLVGEPQIFGQLKSAYRTASDSGVMGKMLAKLFQASFSIAKKIRATTDIGKHPISVAFAAVTLAKQIFTDLSKATVTLIGAGENIELLLRHLHSKDIKQLIIVNRTYRKAKQLADKYQAQALPLTELAHGIAQADMLISSIDSDMPIVTQETVAQAFVGVKRRPVLMIDLGVPRNIAPELAQHDDIYLYSVDDLQGIVTENLKARQMAAIQAEIMIEAAGEELMGWIKAQQKLRTISLVRHKAQLIKDDALQLALQEIDQGKDPKIVLTHFAHRLTQKLIHYPTMGIRQTHADDKNKIEVVKEIFSIE